MAADQSAGGSGRLAATLGFIVRHPANRRRRLRALLTFAAWQVWKRTIHRPITAKYWHGLKLRVYPDSRSASLALYTGLPEYDDMLFTARFLRPGDIFVDVGANVGLYSLLAAGCVPDGRVIALEPHPVAADRLRENVNINGFKNVEVQAVAVGPEPGTARLTADLDTVNYILLDGSTHDSITVPVVSLDSLIEPGVQLALVKVDAEGFESAVLAGAGRLLRERAVMAWIVEVRGHGDRYGAADNMVTDVLQRSGYSSVRYRADRKVLEPADPPSGEAEWNLIFARDEAEVRRRLGAMAT